jgi:hypothetical protein
VKNTLAYLVEPDLVKFELVKPIRAMLRPFLLLALLDKGGLIRMLQWLGGARTPLSTLLYAFYKLET